METIRPRWEWRTFGRRFGPAEAAFAALEPTGVQESDELYLLSAAGDNVKVRDDLMDIKVLQETDADGLQRWTPVMKAAFPLRAADAVRVVEALRLPAVPHVREDYTLDQFLAEVVEPAGTIRVVRVHKRRVRYTRGWLHRRGLRGLGGGARHAHHRHRGRGSGRRRWPPSVASAWAATPTSTTRAAWRRSSMTRPRATPSSTWARTR